MAQVRAVVGEGVLEKLFTGEELEIRVVDPALAHPFIGQPRKRLDIARRKFPTSMARMDSIVEVDAGEDGENVGLKECD